MCRLHVIDVTLSHFVGSLPAVGMCKMIEEIEIDDVLYAIIIRNSFKRNGIHFFTPNEFSQQLAYMSWPTGHIIKPHYHRAIERQILLTQEVLVIKRGRLRVNFYNGQAEEVWSGTLEIGDVALLSNGGHGFEVLEDCEIIEVKQGPYLGDNDKVVFSPSDNTRR